MQKLISPSAVYTAVLQVRNKAPLVLNITNLVTMQRIADMLLAIGASPLMAHASSELDDISTIAQALVLNIGTLDDNWISSMQCAQDYALQKNIPITLDPVGAGASKLRTKTAKQILKNGVSIIRGNASEILALCSDNYKTKGVDSLYQTNAAIEAGQRLACDYNCCVAISGKDDVICSQDKTITLSHGHELLTRVTGMGCAVTAMIGAFSALIKDSLQACSFALLLLNISAEIAAKNTAGPGQFYIKLLDILYTITEQEFLTLNIRELYASTSANN